MIRVKGKSHLLCLGMELKPTKKSKGKDLIMISPKRKRRKEKR